MLLELAEDLVFFSFILTDFLADPGLFEAGRSSLA